MKINNKNKLNILTSLTSSRNKGFTLIEILTVVAIIAILVSVVLVSLISAKIKSQDNSAFTSFKSIAAPAFMCLTSGANLNPYDPDTDICDIPSATVGSKWPTFIKYGWADFSWCNVNSSLSSVPAAISDYNPGISGGDNNSGNFCFMLQKDSKSMWCTVEGCRKEGF